MIYKNIIINIAYPAAYADHRIYSVVFIFVKRVIPKFALFGFLLIFFKGGSICITQNNNHYNDFSKVVFVSKLQQMLLICELCKNCHSSVKYFKTVQKIKHTFFI